ncbi:hypothetical protein, partial [Bacteroides heparinolyticus]|uniref:hypothetical protein n=1 Tax=Prevotella heparinolytica TaxID=28113 RepID=UPI0035A0EB50
RGEVPDTGACRVGGLCLSRQSPAVREQGGGGETGRWLNIFLFFVWKLPEFPLTLFIVEL